MGSVGQRVDGLGQCKLVDIVRGWAIVVTGSRREERIGGLMINVFVVNKVGDER